MKAYLKQNKHGKTGTVLAGDGELKGKERRRKKRITVPKKQASVNL